MGSVISGVSSAFGLGGNTRGQNSLDEIKNRQLQAEAELAAQQERLNPARQTLENQLVAQGTGQAPSIADIQMKQALERSLSQQVAAAKSARGVNPALASRNAAMAGAQMQGQVAGQSAAAKLAEQRQNQGTLTDYLQNQRAQRTAALGAGAQTSQAQIQADLQKKQSDMGLIGGLAQTAGQLLSDENQKKDKKPVTFAEALKEAGKAFGGQQNLKGPGLLSEQEFAQLTPEQQLFAGIQGAGAGIKGLFAPAAPVAAMPPEAAQELMKTVGPTPMMSSDKNAKTEIESGGKAANKFLNALQAYKYKYKNPELPGAAEGERVGVMAQDLEKGGKMGKDMVLNTPNGKMVDMQKGFGAILAAQAELNKRLNKIEGKKG